MYPAHSEDENEMASLPAKKFAVGRCLQQGEEVPDEFVVNYEIHLDGEAESLCNTLIQACFCWLDEYLLIWGITGFLVGVPRSIHTVSNTR